MKLDKVKQLVGNKFFKATFIKKSGEKREMIARLGVTKHLKGGEKSYNANDFNYLTVFDMQKRGYRTINVNTLISIKTKGKVYEIE
jgi:hypothetical protein